MLRGKVRFGNQCATPRSGAGAAEAKSGILGVGHAGFLIEIRATVTINHEFRTILAKRRLYDFHVDGDRPASAITGEAYYAPVPGR